MKKKILFLSFTIIAAILTASAQPRSIGLRLGPNTELSFQQLLNYERNMLEIDAGFFYFQGIHGAITYNWISSISSSSGSGTWSSYAGLGAGGGYNWGDNSWYQGKKNYYLHHYATVGLAGMLGLEYKFNSMPLAISLDYRPLIGIDLGKRSDNDKFGIQYHRPGLWNFGLSGRFTF